MKKVSVFFMDMCLKLGSLEERRQTVRSSTYVDALHKFNSLNLLNTFITTEQNGIEWTELAL